MLTENDIDRIQRLKARGYAQARVARELGISRNTVRKYWDHSTRGEEDREGIIGTVSNDLLNCLSRWLSALCQAIPLTYTDENALMVCLRKEIRSLDPLIVKRLREDKRARQLFFVQFIWLSELGLRYRSEKKFEALLDLDPNYRPFPNLMRILKEILDGKGVKRHGPYFPPFIKRKELVKAEETKWIGEEEDIPGDREGEE